MNLNQAGASKVGLREVTAGPLGLVCLVILFFEVIALTGGLWELFIIIFSRFSKQLGFHATSS